MIRFNCHNILFSAITTELKPFSIDRSKQFLASSKSPWPRVIINRDLYCQKSFEGSWSCLAGDCCSNHLYPHNARVQTDDAAGNSYFWISLSKIALLSVIIELHCGYFQWLYCADNGHDCYSSLAGADLSEFCLATITIVLLLVDNPIRKISNNYWK